MLRQRRGIIMSRPKLKYGLTESQVMTILSLKGKVSTRNLAIRYSVSRSTIIAIQSGAAYPEIREKWLDINKKKDIERNIEKGGDNGRQ
jgi:hypothetical protein